MKASSPSSRRGHGVLVRATHQAKAVASARARIVRGSAIRMLFASTRNVAASASTVRQFARVSAPGCPGAVSLKLP